MLFSLQLFFYFLYLTSTFHVSSLFIFLSSPGIDEEKESYRPLLSITELSAPDGAQITNSDIFIICTIETLVHYSKHFLYTEKMVRPKAQNGSSIIAAQHFFNFIHIVFFVKIVS